MNGFRRPRWRCGENTCPAHRWQTVRAYISRDPVQAALDALDAHYRQAHADEDVRTEREAA
jgi:hypothetical protein